MGRPKNREEFRQQMAEAFVQALEEKGLCWKQGWNNVGLPQNGVTKAEYKGCNSFNLALTAMLKGYEDPRWMTMLQIMDTEGKYHPKEKWHLKAGSKATWVEYWYPYDLKNQKAVTWDEYKSDLNNGRKSEEFKLSTRYTAVFNADDIEGIAPYSIKENPSISQDTLIARIYTNMGTQIQMDGGDRAYYSPMEDKVHVPKASHFKDEYAYNATLLHELSHATGHKTRLNRDQTGMFGSPSYAYEELVAEMTSCFMAQDLKTQPTEDHLENHKAYVQSWINAVNKKPDILIRAIKDAQCAATYLDWKSELISDKEYETSKGKVIEIKMNVPERTR